MNKEQLLQLLTPHGQEHLVAWWDELDAAGRAGLAAQIRQVDFAQLAQLYRGRERQDDFRALADRAQSPPAVRLAGAQNLFTPAEARQRGTAALRAGQVGVILVAGGQGTRLGFPHPKGMFPIGPVSGRSLFQVHVEKIVAAARRYGARIPLSVMTSPATDAETRQYFAAHGRFGLAEEDFCAFCQGTMPAVDLATGRVLLEARDRIAVSPDGHGGLLAALVRSGALAEIERRGIRTLFYFQVDNPLVDICGAEFLGYHLLAEAEMTTQVVAKSDPLERVGNVVAADGRLHVIEYSDLPDEAARRRNTDGTLQIWAGSIAVHAIETGLVRREAQRAAGLPFHIARKKVACLDAAGQRVEPAQPNAVKFERFIFDLIPAARRALVVEIDPADGFAPLKNAPGAERDTADWVRQQMIAQHRRWLAAAGARVDEGVAVEICPLWAADAAEVAAKLAPGTRVTRPTYFC